MPLDPPRRRPSGAMIDRVEPGAVNAPHAEAPTGPPPAPDRRSPPVAYRAPRPSLQAIVVPRLQAEQASGLDESWEPTLHGVGPSSVPPMPPAREKLDSVETSAGRLLDELMAERKESAELRQQLRALDVSYHQPRVEVAPISHPPKKAEWAKLLFGLGGALTLFLGAAGTYLGARAATKEQAVENVAAAASAQRIVVDPLPGQIKEVARDTGDCRSWARAWDDYNRQVLGKMGVIIPEQPNAPPVKSLEFDAVPMRRNGVVTGGPLLRVRTPPPPLP